MATISELESRVATLKAAYDAAAQDLAKAQAEWQSLVDAAKSTNFKLPEQEAAFIAAREKARSYRDGPLAAATTAENKAAGALYQAEQDLKDARAAPPPPPPATQSTGQTVADDQKANTQGADTQRPDPAPQVVSDDGAVKTASSSTTPSTAQPTESGTLTTGTDGRLRPASETQGLGQTNGTTDNSYEELEKRRADRALPPKGVGAAASGDDASGANPVVASLQKTFGSTISKVEVKPNPLSKYASYTYGISIYQLTPVQYNQLLTTKRKSVAGLSLLMQSGGVPNEQRNQFFPLDYYIDGVEIKTLVNGKGTGDAHTATEIRFRIIEPNGLTFIHNLVRATANNVGKKGDDTNAFFDQLYLMVIRFYGYDQNGNLISNGSEGGTISRATGEITEKFIPFHFGSIRTRIANKLVEYECLAYAPQNYTGTGQARGVVQTNVTMEASTLKEMLSVKLAGALNNYQTFITKEDQQFLYPDVYEIKLLPPLDSKSVTVVPPGDVWKPNTGMDPDPKASPDQKLNPKKQSMKSTVKPYTIWPGTSIVQAIDQMVRTSSYVYLQQVWIYNNEKKKMERQSGAGKFMAWYRISCQAEPQPDKWDPKRGDYAYKITYQVAPYLVTDVISDYFPVSPRWQAPKEYHYWFTGKNTEILDYHQDLDNLYYWVVNVAQEAHSLSPLKNLLNKANQPNSNQSAQGIGGDGKTNEPSANAADRMYSPGDLIKVNMTILGDPDWIQQGDLWSGLSPELDPSATIPDGINFESREALFDIVFNTPGDYDLNQGIIHPPSPGDIPNVSYPSSSYPKMIEVRTRYLAYQIINKFDKGKFTQEIEGAVVLPDVDYNEESTESAGTPTSNAPQTQTSTGTNAPTGMNTPTSTARSPSSTLGSTPSTKAPASATTVTPPPSTPEEQSVANDSARGTEFLDPVTKNSTRSTEPTPQIAPQSQPEPPTSNGQDVSVPQTTPQPGPSSYVTYLPDGVTKGTTSGTYQFEGQTIVAGTNDALSAQVSAIRTGNEVTYQDYDSGSGWVTKTYNPWTKTYKIIGNAPNPYANTPTTAPSQNMAKEY